MTREGGKNRGLFERPAGSGIWWVRYHDAYGREHRERVGAKSLAQQVYTRRRAAVLEERFNADIIRRRAVTIEAAVEEYLSRRTDAASIDDMRRYGAAWVAYLGPGRSLRDIRQRDVELYRAARVEKVSAQTLYHELSLLRAVLTQAVEDGRLDRHPVHRLKQPRAHRVRYLSAAEEAALYAKLPAQYHAALTVALHTGMRQAEQFGLTWGQVDLAARVIRLKRSKSGHPRIIELNDSAAAALRALPTRLRGQRVFTHRKGQPINVRNFYARVFVPALEAAGIEDFRWHDLRHTFATRLVQAGVDLRTVADLLGHTSLQMVMRYAHLAPGARAKAVRLLDEPAPAPDKQSVERKKGNAPGQD